jgi:hypothetical protein
MSVNQIALDRALKLLAASGAQYAVIGLDGVKYGTLDVVEPKPAKKKVFTHAHGEFRDYFMPFIGGMKPGDSVKIPPGKYQLEELRGPLSSWCSTHWGAGNTITSIDRKANLIEVLRVS